MIVSHVTWTSGSLAGPMSHAGPKSRARTRETSSVKILTKNEITVDDLANSVTNPLRPNNSIHILYKSVSTRPYISFRTDMENLFQSLSGWGSFPIFS